MPKRRPKCDRCNDRGATHRIELFADDIHICVKCTREEDRVIAPLAPAQYDD